MKTFKTIILLALLTLIVGCSTSRIHPADMKYEKNTINKHKSTKVLKVKICNKNR